MAEPRHWYLVMYDVLDPVRLRHVHKICRSWGERVQLSIFRVRGTARELAQLEFELARVMEATDRLLLVRLCPGCASVVKVKGPQLEPFELEVPPCKLFLAGRPHRSCMLEGRLGPRSRPRTVGALEMRSFTLSW
jgi:CRISPR-associated protein Cas2